MVSFFEALESNSVNEVAKVPKSDVHNHAGRGGSRKVLSDFLGVRIYPRETSFVNISEMEDWFSENIKVFTPGVDGLINRFRAAFIQARLDQILVLSMSFSLRDIDTLGGVDNFISVIDG